MMILNILFAPRASISFQTASAPAPEFSVLLILTGGFWKFSTLLMIHPFWVCNVATTLKTQCLRPLVCHCWTVPSRSAPRTLFAVLLGHCGDPVTLPHWWALY